MLRWQAEQYGERPLLSLGPARWSHAEAPGAVARRAGTLTRAGVRRGDRVALLCNNGIECLELFLACGWIGAVSVPINTASMGPQIGYCLANSGARLLVTDASFVERLATADLSGSVLETVWVVGSMTVTRGDLGVPCHSIPEIGAAVESAQVGPGETLAILYTSGTTGPSKGVTCPHAQFYWWGVHTAEVLGLTPDDVLATTLPLFHINALNTYAQAALSGAAVVYAPRFSASGFWASMADCRASVVYLLGAMVPILLALPEGQGERAHRVRVGLGPGVPATAGQAFLRRTGVRLLEGYGSTETNFVIASRPDVALTGRMGWLRPGFDARVVDADDVPVADGVAGELVLRAEAPYAFATGYFDMPEKTVEAWRNLWFHTGDRVLRDPDGGFRFIDRIKDAIRRRGENISSYEVEQVLLSHPSVASVAVFPVRSDLAEDEVMATLVLRSGLATDAAALAAHCAPRLPYFAVPRYIDIVDSLPCTENGKVQKYKLRDRGVTPGTWDRSTSGV